MRFETVRFAWSGAPPLLDGFSLDIAAGSITALVGASGCGKSTLLRLAAGLLSPQQGNIAAAEHSRSAFVFQSPNLLPWRNIQDNVALPLQLQGMSKEQRHIEAQRILASVGLSERTHHLPRALSGGMRMRASLARALVTKPDTLLMDEPFSALDALTRRQMHDVFLDLWSQTGLTVLFVTHDLEEAVLLSDRVVAVAGQPLTIAADHAIALPRPRQRHSPAVQQRVLQLEQTLEASP